MGAHRPFLAVDWGTSNRRAYRVENGEIVSHEADDRGILKVGRDGFAAEVVALRDRHAGLPVLMAGMVGSNRGWVEAPYVACPAGLAELAGALKRVEPDVAIVPGVSVAEDGRADVMRGEEVQMLGAAALGLIPPDGVACHPGTHAKWVEMEDGRIARFRTIMTGELFALLRDYSILSDMIRADPVEPGPAFLDGVEQGFENSDLASRLFQVRARVLLGRMEARDAGDHVSGLLIGNDLRIGLGRLRADVVPVVGEPALTRLYAAALDAIGRDAVEVEGERAFVAGLAKLAETAL